MLCVMFLCMYLCPLPVFVGADRTPMHLAAENGHAHIIEILADKFKASIFERTKDGSTLMHIASLNGHAECATMLFKKGVYLHMPNKNGARSIHTAAAYGHTGIINTLLQKGEKVDVTTNVGILQAYKVLNRNFNTFLSFFGCIRRKIIPHSILPWSLPNRPSSKHCSASAPMSMSVAVQCTKRRCI